MVDTVGDVLDCVCFCAKCKAYNSVHYSACVKYRLHYTALDCADSKAFFFGGEGVVGGASRFPP